MSALASAAVSATVSAAVLLTPAHLRSRYREQWRADLRDAKEAGVPASQIVMGALRVALAADRRSSRPLGAPLGTASMRGRVAGTLALSVAVLGLSGSATTIAPTHVWLGGAEPVSAMQSVLIAVWSTAAALATVVLVASARGMTTRARLGALLLLAVGTAPLVHRAIASPDRLADYGRLTSPAWLVYVVAAALTVIAVRMMAWRLPPRLAADRAGRAKRFVAIGLIVIAVTTSIAVAIEMWSGRPPLDPPVATAADGSVTRVPRDSEEYLEWARYAADAEREVAIVFVVVAGLGLIVVIAAALLMRRLDSRGALLATVGAVAVVVLTFVALVSYLVLMVPSLGAGPSTIGIAGPGNALALGAQVLLLVSVMGAARRTPAPAPQLSPGASSS